MGRNPVCRASMSPDGVSVEIIQVLVELLNLLTLPIACVEL